MRVRRAYLFPLKTRFWTELIENTTQTVCLIIDSMCRSFLANQGNNVNMDSHQRLPEPASLVSEQIFLSPPSPLFDLTIDTGPLCCRVAAFPLLPRHRPLSARASRPVPCCRALPALPRCRAARPPSPVAAPPPALRCCCVGP